jgi:hypothetical protein
MGQGLSLATPTTTTSNTTNTIDRNKQTLTDIQSLQNNEQDLFTQLEMNIANNTLTPDLKNKLTGQISELTELRVNLYSFLNNNSQNTIGNFASTNNLYGQQGQTIIIVENELNQTKQRLEELNNIKSNNLRMVEINKYYGDKYQDQTYFMMLIVLICIILIILKFLNNRNILPGPIYVILLIITLTTGFIFLFWKIVYLYAHDNFDYSKYKWTFNTTNAPRVDTSNPGGQNPWKFPGLPDPNICTNVNKYCGDGTTYDSVKNMCVPLNTGYTEIPNNSYEDLINLYS